MAPLTPTTAHVVDEVLTGVVQDYGPTRVAWDQIFKQVVCRLVDGQVVVHDRSALLKLPDGGLRAPDGTVQERTGAFTKLPVALAQRSLAGKIPRSVAEQAMRIPGGSIDLKRREMEATIDVLALQIEIRAAELLQNVANYVAAGHDALAGNAQWHAADANPRRAVLTARDEIYIRTGAMPNTLALGLHVIRELLLRKDVQEQARQVRNLLTEPVGLDDLKRYFDVEKIVPLRSLSAETADAETFDLVWGNIAWLGAVDQTDMTGGTIATRQTWGVGLRLDGYPLVDQEVYEPLRTSYVYPCHTYDTPAVITKGAAHLWTNVVPDPA